MKKELLRILSLTLFVVMMVSVTNTTTFAASDTVYLSEQADISGSINEYTGSIENGSDQLTVNGNHDFEAGQGIAIANGSSESHTNNWLITTVKSVDGNTLTLNKAASNVTSNSAVIHDDTIAVNAVISGGNATYVFDVDDLNVKGLDLGSNATYEGNGATLHLPKSYSNVGWVQSMITVEDDSDITFTGFTVDGGLYDGVASTPQLGVALLKINDSQGIEVTNNTFKRSNYTAVVIDGSVSDVEVSNNTIKETGVAITAMPEYKGVLNLTDATFAGNVISGGKSEGISILSGMNDNSGKADNILIQDNTVSGKPGTGITYGSRTTNVKVIGNIVKDTNNGIVARDESLEPVNTMINDSAVIADNTISSVNYNHLILDGKNITIENNTFKNGKTVILLGRGNVENVEVSNNDFVDIESTPETAVSLQNVSGFSHSGNTYNGVNEDGEVTVEDPTTEDSTQEDPTTEEPVQESDTVYLSSNDAISGSTFIYTGSMTGGRQVITLTTSHDFLPGQGVLVQGAGNDDTSNKWLSATIVATTNNTLSIDKKASTSVSKVVVLHDDTKAVNEAIQETGKTYIFDFEDMNVKGIKFTSGNTFDGQGVRLHLPQAYSNVKWVQNMLEVRGQDDVTVKNFVIDGDYSDGVDSDGNTGVSLLNVIDSTNITVDSSTFEDTNYSALVVQGEVSNLSITDNSFTDTGVAISVMPLYMGTLKASGIEISGNSIYDSSREGISIVSGMRNNSGYADDILIHDNTIDTTAGSAIQYGSRTTNITVSDNTIKNSNNGITARDENNEPVKSMINDQAKISGNYIADVKYNHMILDGKNIEVSDNTMVAGTTPILLGRGEVDTVSVKSNNFTDFDGTEANVVYAVNATNVDVSDNTINDVATEDPTTEDPTTEDPTTEDPTTEDPTTEDPTTEDPTTEDPTTEDPTTEDPTTEDPTTEDPTTEEPVDDPVVIDPIDGHVYLSQFENISNSIQEFTGSISAGSNALTINGSHDFKAGYGIAIEGASNKDYLNNWFTTQVTKVEGNTVYLSENATKNAYNIKVIHDDTQAVNEAIKNGNATYHFDLDVINVKGVNLQSNATYLGDGVQLNLPISYSAVQWVQGMILATDVSNITIEGFTIDGGKTRGVHGDDITGVALFLALDSNNITVRNNTFQNNFYIGVDFQGNIRDIQVLNNNILNTDVGILAMPEWQGVLYLENALYQGNYIDGGTSEGVSIESGMYSNPGYAKNVKIIDNVIKNKSATGIQYGGRTYGMEILNNDISNSNNGITTRDENLEPVDHMTSDGAIIRGNIITNVKWNPMILDGKNITVERNTFNGGSTIILLGRGEVNGIMISNNIFNNITTSPEQSIIKLKTSNVTVRDNTYN